MKRCEGRPATVCLFVVCVLACVAIAAAQTYQGALRGAVRDAQGVIPGAEVTLINEDTNAERSAMTNDVGEYLNLSTAADGKTLAAIVGTASFDLFVADRSDESGGKRLTVGTGDQLPHAVAVAPKSGAVVYAFDRGDGSNLAMIDRPGAAPRQLTNDDASDNPAIAPRTLGHRGSRALIGRRVP